MFSAEDRILFFAPHPDDESLAGAGLLQRAFRQQAPTRVVYVTSGDNNVWAQRLFERRWNVGWSDRKRWGERRKLEATAALKALGGSGHDACFLDLPDQGLTRLLMGGVRQVFELLRDQLTAWRPTLVVQPAAEDAHPDHSALHVLLSLVASSYPERPWTTLNYVVHRPRAPLPDPAHTLALDASEVAGKLHAILMHETQIAASRKRFTGYAQPEERFYDELSDFFLQPPVREVSIRDGELAVEIASHTIAGNQLELLLVMQTEDFQSMRWVLWLSRLEGDAFLRDAVTGSLLHAVPVCRRGDGVTVRLPGLPRLQSAFVKPQGRPLFFDRAGWIRVPRIVTSVSEWPRGHQPVVKTHLVTPLAAG
ncbi:MAG TPA: PIG-L family deacetylase [Chthoniobacterales bacterium]